MRYDAVRIKPLNLLLPLFLSLLALPLATPAHAQSGSLSGAILTSVGEFPIPNAEIIFDNLSKSVRSDSAGKYTVTGIPNGVQHITVRSVGYEPYSATLTFRKNEKVEADFVLDKLTVLKPVDVLAPYAARLQDFESRRHSVGGKFLTYDQLSKVNHLSMSSIIAKNFPGLKINTIQGYNVITSRGTKCAVQILVNDVVQYNGDVIFFDANSIQTDVILGIEFYTPMYTPIEFMKRPRGPTGGSGCGTMMIWTK